MAGQRSLTTKCLLKRSGEFLHAFFRHLPLVVVGAVTGAASRLLFAAHVQAKIFYAVIHLVAIHVVDAFFGRKRSTKMRCHDKPVFHDGLLAALHGAEVLKPFVWNGANVNEDVTRAGKFFVGAVSAMNPLVLSSLQLSPSAFPTKALKVFTLHFYAHFAGRSLAGSTAAGACHANKNFASSIQAAKAHFFAYRRMFDWCVVRNSSHVY